MPGQKSELALLHVQRDVAQRVTAIRVFLGDVRELDHRSRASRRKGEAAVFRDERLDRRRIRVKARGRESAREA